MTTYDDWYSDLGGAPAVRSLTRMDAMARPSFRQEKRVQESFSAGIERRALTWLAARMPKWVNSDHLTALGAAGMWLSGASYVLSRWHRCGLLAAALFLAVNWFGDSLDGTLARVRNCQRPRYGFYVDHVLDSFGALFLIGGLGLSGYMSPWIATALLVVFLLLSIETYLATYTLGWFQLSHGKLGPTEIRIALIAGSLVLFFRADPHVLGRRFLLFDVGGVVGAAAMAVMLLASVIVHIRQLYREEPLP